MYLVLEITKGKWFKEIIHKENEEINLPHVKRHIVFLDPGIFTTVMVKGHHIKAGRATSNHLILDDFRVSRFHCELIKHPLGHWCVKDLNSTYETHIKRGSTTIKVPEKGVRIMRDDKLIIGGNNLLVLFFEKPVQLYSGKSPSS